MDMNLMLIIVQENDAESLASAFKRSQIQATRIDGHMFVDVQKTIVIGGATIFILGEARLMKVKGGCCGD